MVEFIYVPRERDGIREHRMFCRVCTVNPGICTVITDSWVICSSEEYKSAMSYGAIILTIFVSQYGLYSLQLTFNSREDHKQKNRDCHC
jgi:hypothetical protein